MLEVAIETRPPLTGRRILVVEDEFLVAEDLVETLRREGADIVGRAPSVRKALALIRSTPELDAAVIDVNLRGEVAFPVVDAMIERQRPFVFATVCQPEEIPHKYRNAPRCAKPLQSAILVRELQLALASQLPVELPHALGDRNGPSSKGLENSTPNDLESAVAGWINAIGAKRDRAAFGEILLAIAPKIKAYMIICGASPLVAEELAQEALLQIWREASAFGSSQTAMAWIFTIARDIRSNRLI